MAYLLTWIPGSISRLTDFIICDMSTFPAPKAFHVFTSIIWGVFFSIVILFVALILSSCTESFPFLMSDDLVILLFAQLFGEVQERDYFPAVGTAANETKHSSSQRDS